MRFDRFYSLLNQALTPLFKAEMCAAQHVRPAKETPPEEESGPLSIKRQPPWKPTFSRRLCALYSLYSQTFIKRGH